MALRAGAAGGGPAGAAPRAGLGAKYRLVDAYRRRHDLPLAHPRVAMLDLAYHDVTRERGLYYLLERQGRVERVLRTRTSSTPPPTHRPTPARTAGRFIRAAKEKRRDFTVDWVHLKLNDQAQRTVLCKDPFAASDPRVSEARREHVSRPVPAASNGAPDLIQCQAVRAQVREAYAERLCWRSLLTRNAAGRPVFSSTGNSGSPVSRCSTNSMPVFVACPATAGTSWPSRLRVTSAGGAAWS